MKLLVIRCPDIKKDIKALRKKYLHAEDDLCAAERLLENGKELRHVKKYGGFGSKEIYKARYVNQDLGNQGLSSGYRIVYEMSKITDSDMCYIIIHVYCKKGGPKEKDIKREVNKRIKSSAYPLIAS
jgi:hypothetical protein